MKKMSIAARLACAKVFSGSVAKVMAIIPAPNKWAIALAVRSGGTVEGTLRHHSLRDGKPLDVVVVGILKEEFINGTGIRRRNGRLVQQHECDGNGEQHADVLEQSGERPIDVGPAILQSSTSGRKRSDLGASPGSRNRKRKSDQLDGKLNGNSDEPLPRISRVRSVRTDRAIGPRDGVGAAKRTGSQRKRGGRPATPAK
jgi:hypothetical protein